MFFSIIVPCFNVEHYLSRCIESILSQDIQTDDSFSIILVNDGSSDHTLDVIAEYEEKYPDLIVAIDLGQNSGQSVARNVAMQYADGDFLFFLDSDDWIEKNTFSHFLSLLEQYPGTDIISCDSDRPSNLLDTTPSPKCSISDYILATDFGRQEYLCQHRLEIGIGGKLIRRTLFTDNDLTFPEGLKYEDNYVCWILFEKAKRILHTNQILYHWYVNPNSTTSAKKNYFDRLPIQTMLLQKMKSEPEYEKDKDIIEYNFWEKAFVETMYAMGLNLGSTQPEILSEIREMVFKQVPDILDNYYINNPTKINHFLAIEAFITLFKKDTIDRDGVERCWNEFVSTYKSLASQ